MDSIVISLGGSVILSDDVDSSFFNTFKSIIEEVKQKYRVYLVVGGGTTARFYISKGRKQGFNEDDLDELGILATRVNASFLTKLLSDTNNKIPITTDEAIKCKSSIVVMGGTSPGHSTDFVGAELAEKSHACCYVIATNVDGVYTKDPRKYDDAKHLSEVLIDDLLTQYGSGWKSAGKNMVIDGPALKHIKDHGINTVVVDGRDLENLKKAIDQEPFHGTKILH